jgi:hypothetical protein
MVSRRESRPQYSGEPVINDPGLSYIERETSLQFADRSQTVQFSTHSAAMIRALLACPFVRVESVEVLLPKECVVGLSGSFPIGALTIALPRQDNRPSRVVARSARETQNQPVCVTPAQTDRRAGRDQGAERPSSTPPSAPSNLRHLDAHPIAARSEPLGSPPDCRDKRSREVATVAQ